MTGVEGVRDRTRLTVIVAAAALALLALIGIWTVAPGIERDLETRADAALQAAGIQDAAVEASGRSLTLSGPARADAARDAALAAASIFGARSVTAAFGQTAAGEAAAPAYRFTASWDGATVRLAGMMPTRDAAEEMIANARDVFPRAAVADEMRIAPNPPDPNWQLAAMGGLRAMRALARAELTMAGLSVTLSGIAASEADRAAASDLLAGLPEPFTMFADIDVGDVPAPTPVIAAYRFGAAFDGQRLALSGVWPSIAARDAMKAALAKARTGLVIDDKTAIDTAAPDGAFADAARGLLLAIVTRADSATLSLEGRTVQLAAIARNADAAKALNAALNDIPAAYDWTAEIGVAGQAPATPVSSATDRPERACQTAMSAALAENPVVFASASAALPDAADALVGRLAEIAATCPEARLEIAGHTDASGNAAKNIQLSEERAAALEAALIVRGVDAARLTARGYGAARPVAPNDTDAGKAQNRRIEVIVRP